VTGGERGLGERDRALLAFERDWRAHAGEKEQAIRARFGVSPARYYQLLGRLVDDPAADAHDPLVVRRLRRRRDQRVRRRQEQPLDRRPGR
jgi:hypothetical protein